jgi:hypothetical protein
MVAVSGLPFDRLTTTPPDGATPFRVTVAVDDVPPVTVPGFKPREVTASGFTVKPAVRVTAEYVAEIVTAVIAATVLVVTVNVVVVLFAAIVTLAGTLAAALLLLSVTCAPPGGAAVVSVTVAVTVVPPATLDDANVREATPGPGVSMAPTFGVGSNCANLRTRTLLKFATVPDSP